MIVKHQKTIKTQITVNYQIKVMKTQNQRLFQQIEKKDTEILTKEVKETIAHNVNMGTTLSSAQLWNIQRRGRMITTRRNYIW